MIPDWLHALSIGALALGAVCTLIVLADVRRHPQHMGIMNLVWPVVALFAGPIALWGYFSYGRLTTHAKMKAAMDKGETPPSKQLTPFPIMVGKGAAHCGAGCTLGDICAEWLVFVAPAIAVWFGYQSIFPDKIFASWIVDYIFAYAFGIVFQYFTIAPMRGFGLWDGIAAAVKADTLSLTAWQVGMYGFMALAYFYFFRVLLGVELETNTPEFWFMMQIAMLCGFATSYPVNWWLIRAGLKEKM
ncbi:MAG: DUF4396 domain-containing protein [Pseudolabrys sp.]|jgi:hypothetical protein